MTAKTNHYAPDINARWESLHRLYDLFVETLTTEAKAPNPKASMLSVIREFLKDNTRFMSDQLSTSHAGQLQSVKNNAIEEREGWGIGTGRELPTFIV